MEDTTVQSASQSTMADNTVSGASQSTTADETAEDAPQSAPRESCGKKCIRFFCVKHPPAIYFLLVNEILELIAGIGAGAIFILYLKEELGVSAHTSKSLIHASRFSSLPYSVLGAWLSDLYFGKFWLYVPTDWIWMSVYITLALSSLLLPMDAQVYFAIAAMFVSRLIQLGGPSIVAFPGDQYDEDKTADRDTFYYAFYFAINLGGLLGGIITPRFRSDIHCMENRENCFPAAFGFVVCTSLLGTIALFAGYRFYRFLPPAKQTNTAILKCFFVALGRRIALIFNGIKKCSLKECKHKRNHWLELADDKYNEKTIHDVKCLYETAVIFTAYPVFFTLFDQQQTLWTLMSSKMDGRTVFGQVLADQMDSWNPALVMVFIVVMTTTVYPLCAKYRFLRRPLERIGYGFVLAALSYVFGGLIYTLIERSMPTYPDMDMTDISFHNGLPCDVKIKLLGGTTISLLKYKSQQLAKLALTSNNLEGTLTVNENCTLSNISNFTFKVDAAGGLAYSVLFVMDKNGTNITYQEALQNRTRENQENSPKIRFVYIGPGVNGRKLRVGSETVTECVPLTETLLGCSGTDCPEYFSKGNSMNYISEICYTKKLPPHEDNKKKCTCDQKIGEYTFLRGGIYDVLVVEDDNGTQFSAFETSLPDSVPVLLQVPMYALLTLGEVLASTTAYAFAYSESPAGTKCFLQAVFYVCGAVGNLYVIIIDELIKAIHDAIVTPDYLRTQETPKGSYIFFVYAALALIDLVYFVFIARRYHYVNPDYIAIK